MSEKKLVNSRCLSSARRPFTHYGSCRESRIPALSGRGRFLVLMSALGRGCAKNRFLNRDSSKAQVDIRSDVGGRVGAAW